MKITNIGGATAILEHEGKRILVDPWLDDGIFYGSWYHFPPCDIKISDLGRFDYVYISHIHEDHCSPGTIKHINKDAEIIIIDRQPNYVHKFLQRYQFNFKKIHLVKERTPTEIAPGLVADMLTGDPEHDYNYLIDSALVLNWNGFVIYDANDCAPYPDAYDYLLKTYKTIDLALIPYTGGSGYPACYLNLSEKEKMEEAKKIQQARIKGFVKAYETLKPKTIMPFADQYAIAGSRAHLNRFLAHPPTPGAVYDFMKEKNYDQNLLLLNSGQSFDFETQRKTPDQPYHFHTEGERENYIEKNLLGKKYDHELFDLNNAVPVDRLLKVGREQLWNQQEKEKYFPDYRLYITTSDLKRTFEIDLQKKDLKELPSNSPKREPYVALSCPASLLVFMLIGQISWNMADASLFIDYERVPNVYDPKIYAYINFIKV